MNKLTIHLAANNQQLTSADCPKQVASNTVSYIEAVFDLGDNWTGYDSVRAVWATYNNQISTVLDSQGTCIVPHEVLTETQTVYVNLVGSNVEGDELVDRLTTYPLPAIIVNADALVEGTETAEVTPSQFEQFIADVAEEVSRIKDIESTTLNPDYTLTIVYSDGSETTVGPIRGEQGPQGETGPQGPEGPPGEVTLATLESLMPTDTANGAIASFPDGQSVFPLKSLTAEINPIQDLHGYDSPWVGGGGANKWDEEWEQGGIDNGNGQNNNAGTNRIRSKNYIPCTPNAVYCVYNESGINTYLYWYDADKNYIGLGSTSNLNANHYKTDTAPANAYYMRFRTDNDYGTTYHNDIAINYPSTITTYSPYSNICPISGWNSVGVVVEGKNLFDKNSITFANGVIANDGTINPLSGYKYSVEYIKVNPSTAYAFSGTIVSNSTYNTVAFYDKDKNFLSRYTPAVGVPAKFTTPNNCEYLRFNVSSTTLDVNTVMLERGSTATTYEAYNGTTHTTTLPSTVYGGTLDVVSGVLTVLYKIWTPNSSNTMGLDNTHDGFYVYPPDADMKSAKFGNGYCSMFERATSNWNLPCSIGFGYNNAVVYFININQSQGISTIQNVKDWLDTNKPQVVYELATPQTIQLTASQINTLKGTNNIFADSGDVSVEYVADIQGYVDKQIQ